MAHRTIDREEIRKLVRAGKESKEIAYLASCSVRSVQRIAKDMDMSLVHIGWVYRDWEDRERVSLPRASYPIKVSRRPLEGITTDYI